jgi:hypothetical protein
LRELVVKGKSKFGISLVDIFDVVKITSGGINDLTRIESESITTIALASEKNRL